MPSRRLLFPVLSLASLLVIDAPASAESVYWNYGLGAIQTGWSNLHNGPVGVKTHIVGIGPDDASPKLQNCIVKATVEAGRFTQRPLDRHIEDSSMVLERLANSKTPPTKEVIDAELKAQTDLTAQMLMAMLAQYEYRVMECMGTLAYKRDTVTLGLVTRVCASWFETEEPCQRPRDPVPRAQDPGTGRYAKLEEWRASRKMVAPLNEIIQLSPNGVEVKRIRPDLRDRYYFPAPSAETAQLYFETGVDRLRSKGWKYDYMAPKAAGVDQSIAVALIDIIANPALAISGLPNSNRRLQDASSEIVRSRIMECALFRGLIGYEEIAKCAGVANEADIIRNCIGGASCRPGLSQEITKLALTITQTDGALALSSPLPRILAAVPVARQYEAGRQCAKRSETELDFALCFTESQLSDDKSRQALACVRSTDNNLRLDCMLNTIGGQDAMKARCLIAAETNAERALCLVQASAPEQVAQAVECANQPGITYESMASCMLAKNIPGDAGKLAACAGSSGGNAMGAALCVAGGGLTAEQRILLQCATQSADPTSYGVCVGGQLALKEFANCQDKNLAEDSCFGENNEIRKFIREIGLGDISENSVVGQILNEHLNLIKFNVRVLEGLGEGLGKLGEEAGKILDQLIPDMKVEDLNPCKYFQCKLLSQSDAPVDTENLELTIKADGEVMVSDGQTSVTVKEEGETPSPEEIQILTESAKQMWEETTESDQEDGVRTYRFIGGGMASNETSDTARAVEMVVPDYSLLNAMEVPTDIVEEMQRLNGGP